MRIIPARAGFTFQFSLRKASAQDHPRSRGVYESGNWSAVAGRGSSPLARGLRGRGRRGPPTGRIIPARAGFTVTKGGQSWSERDHPRSRGVYGLGWCSCPRPEGSSPLARGLPAGVLQRSVGPGIIPARAGFTCQRQERRLERQDHPRSRGVYFTRFLDHLSEMGSSPLARGLLRPRRPLWRRSRIIPARAGFTCSRKRRFRSARDHPRSRGVYSWTN